MIYDGDLLDELHCSHIPTYIASYERLQNLPIQTVYPGHYQIFGKDRYQQIIVEYLEARRKPGCPSDQVALKNGFFAIHPQS